MRYQTYGRMSASQPNLQNHVKHTELGQQILAAFRGLFVHDGVVLDLREGDVPVEQVDGSKFTVDADFGNSWWLMPPIVPHVCAPIRDNLNKRDRRSIRRCVSGLRNVRGTKQVQQHLNNYRGKEK